MSYTIPSFVCNEDRVLIDMAAVPDKSKGGLHIPDDAKGKPTTGRVVVVGPGNACMNCGHGKKLQPEVGMFVLFPDSAGTEIEIDGKEYKIIRSADIHGHDPEQFDAPSLADPQKIQQPIPETMIE